MSTVHEIRLHTNQHTLSELEYLVAKDMVEQDLDHATPEDIKKFWSERLDD